MATKNAAGEKVSNVADALKARAKRMGPPKKTITLRATQRGYYGRPLPDLIDPGTEFAFAISDFDPAGKHAGRETITIDGTEYELPTWCEDARKPATVVREDEDDDESDTSGSADDVI
jgi:hypothetical protein